MQDKHTLGRDAVTDLIRNYAIGAMPGHADVRQMLLYELWQLDVIWKRFVDGRADLHEIDQDIERDEGDRDLEIAMRVDVKSLFLFGDILLSTCALATKLVDGKPAAVEYDSYSRFLSSVRGREVDDLPTRIIRRAGDAAENIESLLGFYRDKFIVHVEYSYSQGVMRGINTPRYQIRHWRRDADLSVLVPIEKSLRLAVPDRGGLTHAEQVRDAESRVEAVVRNLHRIADKDARRSAAQAVRSIGILAPDPHEVMNDLCVVVSAFLVELHLEAVCNREAKGKES